VERSDAVVVVECTGEIAADSGRLLQPAFASETLRAFDGELRGKGLKFGPGKVRDAYVEEWSNQDGALTWQMRLSPGRRLGWVSR